MVPGARAAMERDHPRLIEDIEKREDPKKQLRVINEDDPRVMAPQPLQSLAAYMPRYNMIVGRDFSRPDQLPALLHELVHYHHFMNWRAMGLPESLLDTTLFKLASEHKTHEAHHDYAGKLLTAGESVDLGKYPELDMDRLITYLRVYESMNQESAEKWSPAYFHLSKMLARLPPFQMPRD